MGAARKRLADFPVGDSKTVGWPFLVDVREAWRRAVCVAKSPRVLAPDQSPPARVSSELITQSAFCSHTDFDALVDTRK